MNSQPALNYNAIVESTINLAKDVYENGPKNNDTASLLLAEHFADLKQQELEVKQLPNYAQLIAADFTENYEADLRGIECAIRDGAIDMELWHTNQLFKTFISQFNKVVAVNPPESWIPVAQIVFDKTNQYIIRDEVNKEFDQYPRLQVLLEDFRKNYSKAHDITGKFLYQHVNAVPSLPTDQLLV